MYPKIANSFTFHQTSCPFSTHATDPFALLVINIACQRQIQITLIDLLFYHRKLKSLVAIELKRSKFKPEYAGKMNFYLNLLDEFVKETDENPSIGIILCGDHSHFDVEYALREIDKPVGVAEYQLTKEIPEQLKNALPNADQIEEKLLFGLGLDPLTNPSTSE